MAETLEIRLRVAVSESNISAVWPQYAPDFPLPVKPRPWWRFWDG